MEVSVPRRAATGGQDLLGSIFEAVAGTGLCLLDAEGRVVQANREWLRSAGLSGQSVTGRGIWELLPGTAEPLRKLHDEVRAGRKVEVPAHARLLDGREAWFEGRLTPVALGDAVGVLITTRDITALQRTEEALHDSERRMANVFRVVQAGILVTSLDDQVIIDVNEEWLKLLGWSRAEVLGQTTAGLEIFESPSSRAWAFAQLRTTGNMEPTEALIRRKDGTTFVCLISASTATIAGENCVSVWQDVTALHQAAAALRVSEARYRLLFESSPLPKWLYDTGSLAFLAVNDAAVRLYGYSREEFLGMTIQDLRRPEDIPLLLASVQANSGGPAADGHWKHRKKDGSEIEVEITGHNFLVDGRDARMVVAQDVTERRKAEEAVRASEAKFAALSRSSIVGLVTSTVEGRLLDANEAFLHLLGYPREELAAGRLSWESLTPPSWRQVSALIGAEIEQRGFAGPIEKEYLRKDGSLLPVILGVAPIDAATRITWVLDISDRKRLEQVQRNAHELEAENRRIQESSRLKSEFLARMSHELRTPLNAIIGFSELLLEGEVAAEQVREYSGHVLSSARRLLGLIDSVLDLARVEAGKMEFRPEELSCRELTGGVAGALGPLAAEKRIHLEVAVDPALGEGVFLDPTRLKQVLFHYLSNALKFTPAGGRVSVRLLPEGDRFFRIEVEDNGPGIAASDLPRLFVHFQQLDGGAARQHGGTGLGLALTRYLVEAQGGSVGVRSEPGHGSVFHAVLPRRAGTAPAPAAG